MKHKYTRVYNRNIWNQSISFQIYRHVYLPFKLNIPKIMNIVGIVITSMIGAWGKAVTDFLFFPLRVFYFNGPSLLGLYEGSEKETICAGLTRVRSEFWSQSADTMEECDILIQRKFNAFVIGVTAVGVVITLACNVYMMSMKHFLLEPLAAGIVRKIDEVHFREPTREN